MTLRNLIAYMTLKLGRTGLIPIISYRSSVIRWIDANIDVLLSMAKFHTYTGRTCPVLSLFHDKGKAADYSLLSKNTINTDTTAKHGDGDEDKFE